MNDIGNVTEFLYTILCADDTCVLLNGKDFADLVTFLNCELDKLSTWPCANKLSLNVQKTDFMVFHSAKIKIVSPIDVTLDNCCLTKTDSFKYLGVIIDQRLNKTQHIAHVKNKISKGIGIMSRARTYLTKNSLKKLCFSYILVYLYLIYNVLRYGAFLPKVILDRYFFYQRRL